MKNQDRSTKILLFLLVAGIWGLLMRPVVNIAPASAQIIPFDAKKQYAMAVLVAVRYTPTEKDEELQRRVRAKPEAERTPEEQERDSQITTAKTTGTTRIVQIGGSGFLHLNAFQVSEVVELANESGWRIHSVVAAGTNGDFVVVLEK